MILCKRWVVSAVAAIGMAWWLPGLGPSFECSAAASGLARGHLSAALEDVQTVDLAPIAAGVAREGRLFTGVSRLHGKTRSLEILAGPVGGDASTSMEVATLSSAKGEAFEGVRLVKGYAYAKLGEQEASDPGDDVAAGEQAGLRDAAFFRWPILVSHGIAGGAEGTELLVHAAPHPRLEGVTVVRVALIKGGPCFATYPKSSTDDGKETLAKTKTFVEFHVEMQGEHRIATVQSDADGRSVRTVGAEGDRAAAEIAEVLKQATDDAALAMAR